MRFDATEAKPVWQSKTLWFNLLAVLGQVALAYGFGDHDAAPWTSEAAVGTIAVINLVLRLTTKQAVRIRKQP